MEPIGPKYTWIRRFIKSFNNECPTHRIVCSESAEVNHLRQYITPHLQPWDNLPRQVLLGTRTEEKARSRPLLTLLAFSLQSRPVDSVSFQYIDKEYRNQNPPLADIRQIFNVTWQDLNVYRKIEKSGVSVVLICFQRHTGELKAQFTGKIVLCNEHTPRSKPEGGTGDRMWNTHFDSYVPVQEFFESEYGIPRVILKSVEVHTKNESTYLSLGDAVLPSDQYPPRSW